MTGAELTDCCDAVVRAYLARHPEATVVALGEGLGAAFWRLDNGRLHWLTVQPPEPAALRRMLLPDGARRWTVGCPVADPRWLAAVPAPGRGVVVLARGAGRRLSVAQVRGLAARCAQRFPGGALVCDAPSWWATALARGLPGTVAMRVRRPAGLRYRLPVLRALLPVVCELRFAAGGELPGNPAARRTHCR
ncbi:hypothetical protein [Streptomyces sp. NPDC020742]|uniref:class I SAM-dependent methyltransferase n=1 Tax=Streptomyces sp. NPDC020742 TaxID=3154897 RepID=UPI0033DB3ABE